MPPTTKRVCLLTGAGGTLGTAFCRLHADRYHIAAIYRRRPPTVPSQTQWFIDPLAPQTPVPENEHSVYAIQADLADDRELARVVEVVLARFDRVDLLVNAAVHSVWAPIIDSSTLLENAAYQFHVNTLLPLKLAALLARSFWRDRDRENVAFNRNVVNVSSIAGVHVYLDQGQSVYSASKAALNYLTYHMGHEFRGIGVRVNAVAPDSFPHIVPTEHVVQAIRRLDEGEMNSSVLIMEREGEHFI